MQSNKGFTLVEILSVIVVLSLVMIISIPSISNVLNKSKNQINVITMKNLEQSAMLFGQEIYMCDSTSNITETLKSLLNLESITCKEANAILSNEGISVTVGFLKQNEYFKDDSDTVDETMEIEITEKNDRISAELVQ